MTEAELGKAMKQTARREMAAYRAAEMVDGFASANSRKGGRRKTNSHVTLAHFKKSADEGMSAAETARHWNVLRSVVDYYRDKYGIEFRDGRKRG
jgi:hypothetical protein